MGTIRDYTNAEVTDVSPTNKVVIRKPSPRYNPRYSKVDEPKWEFEMITFDELEELRSTVDKTLEEEVKRLQSSGQTRKTKEVYFLEHKSWRALIVKEKPTPHKKETSQKKYSPNYNLSRLLALNFRFNLN
jgi:hypothetical protein